MQPYFLPYIGYFQLIHAVDEFVLYDNIQFTKKGWIHRNRMLQNGKDEYFSISLKKDSDYLDVRDRTISQAWTQDREKTLRKIKENYRKAPNFDKIFPLMEEIFMYNEENLFNYIYHSIKKVCEYLDIHTNILISSRLPENHNFRSQDRVISILKSCHADTYLNPIGGYDLYNNTDFKNAGIILEFHKSQPIEYKQLEKPFMPWLSILDVLMFNSKDQIKTWLGAFDILKKDE